ncbi:MAG: hypothetical protein WKF75_01150 [Singulisphaera sp.]
MTDAELAIDAEKFDAGVREGLVRFFRKALHRDPERFHNAEEMRWACSRSSRRRRSGRSRPPAARRSTSGWPGGGRPDTPVAALGLSTVP